MRGSKELIYIGLAFLVIGIIMLIVGIDICYIDKEFFETAKPISATVERIEVKLSESTTTNFKNGMRVTSRKESKSYEAYGSYTINNQQFTNISLGRVSRFVKKGDKIKVYYQEDNYMDVRRKTVNLELILIFGFMGMFFSVVGWLIFSAAMDLKGRMLKKNGRLYHAPVTSIEEKKLNTYDGEKVYYCIKCEARSVDTGEMMYFTSENIAKDLSECKITAVPIYVNVRNPKKYRMDIDSVLSKYCY